MWPPAKVNGVWPFNDAWLRTSFVVGQTPGATQTWPQSWMQRENWEFETHRLTAPGERRIVGGGEVEAHHPEQRVQEPFGLAQREMVEESQGQGGLDGEIRVAPLPISPAAPAGRPGSDRFRGQPHRHIAAANDGPVVGRPIRNAVLRLIRGMNLRLHPCSVAPAETRRAGQTAPPAEGLSCNNAPSWCQRPSTRAPRAITEVGHTIRKLPSVVNFLPARSGPQILVRRQS